jgi:hypothetical protein
MTKTEAIKTFLSKASGYVGTKEIGTSNRGPLIDAFNNRANAPMGSPWCAAFMAYVGSESLGSAYPCPLTADCDVLLSFGRRRKILHRQAAPGDLFLRINPGDADDATHTGCVTSSDESGCKTIEGNTNDTGAREGTSVLARARAYSDTLVFVRWSDLLDDTAGGDEGIAAWKVFVGTGGAVLSGTVDNNRVFVPFRDFMRVLFGADADKFIGYDASIGGVLWTGKPLPSTVTQRTIADTAYVAVRPAAEWMGLSITADSAARVIKVSRSG